MKKEETWLFYGGELTKKLAELEHYLNADVISLAGVFFDGFELSLRKKIEELRENNTKRKTLYIILTTNGGSAKTVERCVHIIRHHYKKVSFIIPDYAYSAGTLFCLSGDKILMDYYSVLGPTDPQIKRRDGYYVPAIGYVNKTKELIDRTKTEPATTTELTLLRDLDFADLHLYDQSKRLSISLAKEWLVKYNLRKDKDEPLLKEIKRRQIAAGIGRDLCDTDCWLTHSRPLHIDTLKEILHLNIENYDDDKKLSLLIKGYYYELEARIVPHSSSMFVQTKTGGRVVYSHSKRKSMIQRCRRNAKKSLAVNI